MPSNKSVLVCLLLACSVARANPLEEAKQIAKTASVQYQLGNFQEAADAYARSYATVPSPGLLFNLGQCQMQLKNYERAIFFFEGYLRDKPDAPQVPLVRDLIAEAKREQAAQKQRAEEAEAKRLEALEKLKPVPIIVPPPPPPPPAQLNEMQIMSLGFAVGGVALGGVAFGLGMHADLQDGLESISQGKSQRAFYADEHQTYTIAASVIGGVGAAAAITGGVLAYLGWHKHKAPAVGVATTGHATSLALTGRF